MAADAFIHCRVTPDTKARLRALAAREQITASALVKQLLETVLRTSPQLSSPQLGPPETPKRDARLYVRLDPQDRLLLASRAEARGMRSATYVCLLVRSHLRGVTPIPKDELLALKRSVAELTAIGRNLNKIAFALNRSSQARGPSAEDLRAILRVAEALRDHFKGLLKANALSWEAGHAETPH